MRVHETCRFVHVINKQRLVFGDFIFENYCVEKKDFSCVSSILVLLCCAYECMWQDLIMIIFGENILICYAFWTFNDC